MATIAINKTEYTKFVDASVEAYTAQCRATTGWEVLFGVTQPAATEAGVLVPAGLEHGVTRANGAGHGWGKLPDGATVETVDVVVI